MIHTTETVLYQCNRCHVESSDLVGWGTGQYLRPRAGTYYMGDRVLTAVDFHLCGLCKDQPFPIHCDFCDNLTERVVRPTV